MASNHAHSDTSPDADQWARLVEIHNHAKSVFLCAEEFDPEFLEFVQPVMELRNGFEHIIRAKAAELGLNGERDAKLPGYIPQSFDKAIGHEYRAFFDAADWFSVCIRDRITKTLKHYSHECITAVLPEYYPKLRPRIDQTCREIASIRGAKDIAKDKDLLAEVAKYRAAIDELLGIYEQIEYSIPALVDWKHKNRWEAVKIWVASAFVGGILTSIVGTWILIKLGLLKP
ncbi:MAG: hypothetical protein WC381_10460 [Kiritimatiellia bacterium]|jgi:hypothetical protein